MDVISISLLGVVVTMSLGRTTEARARHIAPETVVVVLAHVATEHLAVVPT